MTLNNGDSSTHPNSEVNSPSEKKSSKDDLEDIKLSSISQQGAIDSFFEAYPEAVLSEVEMKIKRGEVFYEVSGLDPDFEYSLKFNGTGNLINQEKETLGINGENKVKYEGFVFDNLLTEEEVLPLVLRDLKGQIVEYTLECDDGRIVYEIEVIDGSISWDVVVDATTGEILEIDD